MDFSLVTRPSEPHQNSVWILLNQMSFNLVYFLLFELLCTGKSLCVTFLKSNDLSNYLSITLVCVDIWCIRLVVFWIADNLCFVYFNKWLIEYNNSLCIHVYCNGIVFWLSFPVLCNTKICYWVSTLYFVIQFMLILILCYLYIFNPCIWTYL